MNLFSIGYNDTGEYWRSWYEAPTFEADVRKLYDEFRPLYQQLHAYVRRKLKNHYGKGKFPDSGHIPAHLFGNMWSQSWSNIYDLLTPYPNAVSVDITQRMKDIVSFLILFHPILSTYRPILLRNDI